MRHWEIKYTFTINTQCSRAILCDFRVFRAIVRSIYITRLLYHDFSSQRFDFSFLRKYSIYYHSICNYWKSIKKRWKELLRNICVNILFLRWFNIADNIVGTPAGSRLRRMTQYLRDTRMWRLRRLWRLRRHSYVSKYLSYVLITNGRLE